MKKIHKLYWGNWYFNQLWSILAIDYLPKGPHLKYEAFAKAPATNLPSIKSAYLLSDIL